MTNRLFWFIVIGQTLIGLIAFWDFIEPVPARQSTKWRTTNLVMAVYSELSAAAFILGWITGWLKISG